MLITSGYEIVQLNNSRANWRAFMQYVHFYIWPAVNQKTWPLSKSSSESVYMFTLEAQQWISVQIHCIEIHVDSWATHMEAFPLQRLGKGCSQSNDRQLREVGTFGDGDLYTVRPKPTSGGDRIQEEYRIQEERTPVWWRGRIPPPWPCES
jgi:hypothetical protein